MHALKNKFFLLATCFATGQAAAATVEAPVIYTEEKPAVVVQAQHPEFSLKLKSNPTTGYSWFLRGYDENLLQPLKHTYEVPTDKKLMGASGYEIWKFHVKQNGFTVPQQTLIRFTYIRPWQVGAQTKQVVFQISTMPASSSSAANNK